MNQVFRVLICYFRISVGLSQRSSVIISLIVAYWSLHYTIQNFKRIPSAGLIPTEARGNYLPEAPYLRETKTYLNCNSRMHGYIEHA